jgi:hypothetical protein
MKQKGVISAVVAWDQARTFFYHRLRRRLLEQQLRRSLASANSSLKSEEITEQIQKLVAAGEHIYSPLFSSFFSSNHQIVSSSSETASIWAGDAKVVDWLESSSGKEAVSQLLVSTRKNFIKHQVASWYKEDVQAAKEVLLEFFPQLKSTPAPAPAPATSQ